MRLGWAVLRLADLRRRRLLWLRHSGFQRRHDLCGVGCTCIGGAPGACDNDMMCCVQGDPGAIGFCLPVDACYVAMAACSDVGCDCAVHDPYACGSDLICCGTGEAGAIGTCQA